MRNELEQVLTERVTTTYSLSKSKRKFKAIITISLSTEKDEGQEKNTYNLIY